MLLPFDDAEDFFRLFIGLIRFIQFRTHREKMRKGKPKPLSKLSFGEASKLHQRFAEDPGAWVAAYIKANPERLSTEELAEIAEWKAAVGGRFIFFRQLKEHLVVIEPGPAPRVYGVLGLTTPIKELLEAPLPTLGECVLLPFRGNIVCDSLISSDPVAFGPEVRKSLEDVYRKAKRDGSILEVLGSPSPKAAPEKAKKESSPANARKKADPLQRLIVSLRKRLEDYRKKRDFLRRFEEEAVPAFETWLDQCFGEERREVARLEIELEELKETLFRLQMGNHPAAGDSADIVETVLAEIRDESDRDEDDAASGELPEDVMNDVFRSYMKAARGVDVREMNEKEVESAFEHFREVFRHAAEGNHAAVELSLLAVAADRSPEHVKAVNTAYRRIAKRLHPDKNVDHDDVAAELWETLREAKIALDLTVIERVEAEWRLLRGEAFAKEDEAILKRLQAQLRADFSELKSLRQELEAHPMWNRKGKLPPKNLERMIRTEILGELNHLKNWKQHLEDCLRAFRPKRPRKSRALRPSTGKNRRKAKTAPKAKQNGPQEKFVQTEFEF